MRCSGEVGGAVSGHRIRDPQRPGAGALCRCPEPRGCRAGRCRRSPASGSGGEGSDGGAMRSPARRGCGAARGSCCGGVSRPERASAARTRVRSPPHSLLPRLAGATSALPDSLAVRVAWRAGGPLMASSDARAPSTVLIQRLRVATADPSLGAQGYRRASMVHVMIPRGPTHAQNTSATVFGDPTQRASSPSWQAPARSSKAMVTASGIFSSAASCLAQLAGTTSRPGVVRSQETVLRGSG